MEPCLLEEEVVSPVPGSRVREDFALAPFDVQALTPLPRFTPLLSIRELPPGTARAAESPSPPGYGGSLPPSSPQESPRLVRQSSHRLLESGEAVELPAEGPPAAPTSPVAVVTPPRELHAEPQIYVVDPEVAGPIDLAPRGAGTPLAPRTPPARTPSSASRRPWPPSIFDLPEPASEAKSSTAPVEARPFQGWRGATLRQEECQIVPQAEPAWAPAVWRERELPQPMPVPREMHAATTPERALMLNKAPRQLVEMPVEVMPVCKEDALALPMPVPREMPVVLPQQPVSPFQGLVAVREQHAQLAVAVVELPRESPEELGKAYRRCTDANVLHRRLHGVASSEAYWGMACCFSLAASARLLPGAAPELPPCQSGLHAADLAEARLDLAVSMLQSAIVAGFTDRQRLLNDPDLDAVRQGRAEELAALTLRLPGGFELPKAPSRPQTPTAVLPLASEEGCSSLQSDVLAVEEESGSDEGSEDGHSEDGHSNDGRSEEGESSSSESGDSGTQVEEGGSEASEEESEEETEAKVEEEEAGSLSSMMASLKKKLGWGW